MKKKKRKPGALRNYTERIKFLYKVKEQNRLPNDNELRKVQRLYNDKNPGIRYDVAEALGLRYTPESEEILVKMTYDKTFLAKVEAVEMLGFGRNVSTLERLEELFQDPNFGIRGYAVMSYFDVWINCYGYHRESVAGYLAKTEKYRCKEERLWVLADYERNRYLSGIKDAAEFLLNSLRTYEGGDDRVMYALVNTIIDIRNIWNQKWINERLKICTQYLPQSSPVTQDTLTWIEEDVYPKILFLDETNTGISQVLEYLGSINYKFIFDSAGLAPQEEMETWAVDVIQERYGKDFRKWQYIDQPKYLCYVEFIVPLGIKIEDEQYPFQKIIRKYEDMTEIRITIEQGLEMIHELILEICNICAEEGVYFDREAIVIKK